MLVQNRWVRLISSALAQLFDTSKILINCLSDAFYSTFYRVMIDCSRNGVLNVKGVKWLLRQMALMGSNMLQVNSHTPSVFSCRQSLTIQTCSCTAKTPTRLRENLSSVCHSHFEFLALSLIQADPSHSILRLLPRSLYRQRAPGNRRLRFRSVSRYRSSSLTHPKADSLSLPV